MLRCRVAREMDLGTRFSCRLGAVGWEWGVGTPPVMRGAGFFSSGAAAVLTVRSLWRNGRARWTSNPEVPGSSPGRDDLQAGVSFILRLFLHKSPSCSFTTPQKASGGR